jgi:hypothetical protein
MDNPAITWPLFFFNVGCSLIASLFFLFVVLLMFKPKLKIAPFICRTKLEFDGETFYYVFKIVNRSLFSAYDVKAELSLLRKYPTPPSGMMNTRFTPLTLALSQISNIPSRRPEWIRKGAEHAIRLRTMEDLTQLLEDEYCSIELRISLRHGLTGLSRVIRREFSHVSQIKHSNFTYGSKFDTLN